MDSTVDGNVDEDLNEGVTGRAKAAEAMAVTVAPSEGGDIVIKRNMAQSLPE